LNNIRFAHFPRPTYGRKGVIIKPIGERLHVKVGAPFRGKDISKVSTPELRMITDEDWWSPEPPETARRAAPVRVSASKLLERPSEEEDAVEAKQKPGDPQKIALLPAIRPGLPLVRASADCRAIGNAGFGRDPRWPEMPLGNRPVRPPDEIMFVPKDPGPDQFGFRKFPWVGFNPRFRKN
jgi:hypothetical protein